MDVEVWRIPAIVFWVVLVLGVVGFGLWGLWRLFLWVVGRIWGR